MREKKKIVRWEHPPPAVTGYERRTYEGVWSEVTRELRARPREYAVIAEGPSCNGLADAITNGRQVDFRPAEDWHAVSRGSGATRRVYCAYVGG